MIETDDLPAWADLQRRQHRWNVDNGVLDKPKVDLLKSLALRMGSVATRSLIQGIDATTVSRMLGLTLSAANAMSVRLDDVAPVSEIKHGSRANDLMDLVGQVCQGAEDIDHLADYHSGTVRAIKGLGGWCAAAAREVGGLDRVVATAFASESSAA